MNGSAPCTHYLHRWRHGDKPDPQSRNTEAHSCWPANYAETPGGAYFDTAKRLRWRPKAFITRKWMRA